MSLRAVLSPRRSTPAAPQKPSSLAPSHSPLTGWVGMGPQASELRGYRSVTKHPTAGHHLPARPAPRGPASHSDTGHEGPFGGPRHRGAAGRLLLPPGWGPRLSRSASVDPAAGFLWAALHTWGAPTWQPGRPLWAIAAAAVGAGRGGKVPLGGRGPHHHARPPGGPF